MSTPTFRIEMDRSTPSIWRVTYGRPTLANLELFIWDFCRSLKIGGVNQHISKALGHVPYPKWAKIVRQRPKGRAGEIIVEWHAAPFQVYP